MPFHGCRLPRAARFAAAFLLLAAAAGCGKGKISGTVTGPDGKPLPLGQITFVPSSGPAVSGDVTDGKYAVQNVPTGAAKVSLDTNYIKLQADQTLQVNPATRGPQLPGGGKGLSPEAAAQFEKMNGGAAGAIQHAKEQLMKYRHIPDKYTKPDDSGLGLTVKGGDNTFDVDLSGK